MSRRIRLHVSMPLAEAHEVVLDGERAHYVGRVLRLGPGDALTLFDGRGGEYAARVAAVRRGRVTLERLEHQAGDRESPLAVHLLQGVSRGARMDIAIQKATELGVRTVQPVLTRHGVVKLADERRATRQAHWQAVATSACEQCGRNRVPEVLEARELDTVLEALAQQPERGGCRLVLDAAAGETRRLAPVTEVTLLVGPEGGLSVDEMTHAAAAGFRAFRLGPRVLRTETAAIAALTVLQARWGDLLTSPEDTAQLRGASERAVDEGIAP